ncbi:MAG TPA: metalloregulator ArsR/SmtB family transcription factor [Kineosporiaceae bacterium]|nr:metalloregulator ArsR/SmtB family transcription factor [Kineosporiaceae bacterium]
MSKQLLPLVTSDSPAACCSPLAVQALTSEQATVIAPMFKALGDPVRLRLMSMIASTREACVCDLTDTFDVSAPTISHHLRVLREAGLVDSERRGTWVYYWIRPDVVRQLGALLAVTPTDQPADEPVGS